MSFLSRRDTRSADCIVNPGVVGHTFMSLLSSIVIAISLFLSKPCLADWPGLLGENRDGKASRESQLVDSLKGNPEIVWQIPAGQGYAGASVIDGKVCLFDRDGSQDRVRLVQLNDGKVLWTKTIPARYSGRNRYGQRSPLCPYIVGKERCCVFCIRRYFGVGDE